MRAIACIALAAALAATFPEGLAAQQATPADVSSVDGIVAALYEVISGPAGRQRDWQRFDALFLPGARLISVGVSPQDHQVHHRVLTPTEYEQAAAPYFQQQGFFEREVHRETERFGQIEQLFSTYESRRAATDAKPFERGINSIQLVNDGRRWWIATVLWDSERPDNPIPAKYLGGR